MRTLLFCVGGFGNGGYAPATASGSLRPANVMMVMMPTRTGTRRPARPGAGRRKRRDADDGDELDGAPTPTGWRDYVPSFGEEDLRILPQVSPDAAAFSRPD